MHLKLRDQQLKTIIYMYIKLLYKNFMVIINQKSVIDTHTKRKRNSNITLKIVIKSQDNETEKEKEKTTNN